jgi:hypothetical protein
MSDVIADDVDQDDVWVVKGGGERSCYHVTEECTLLVRSHRGSRRVPVTHRLLQGLDLCGACGRPSKPSASRPTLASELRHNHDADEVGGKND